MPFLSPSGPLHCLLGLLPILFTPNYLMPPVQSPPPPPRPFLPLEGSDLVLCARKLSLPFTLSLLSLSSLYLPLDARILLFFLDTPHSFHMTSLPFLMHPVVVFMICSPDHSRMIYVYVPMIVLRYLAFFLCLPAMSPAC